MSYEVVISRLAAKEIKKIDRKKIPDLLTKIKSLKTNPRPAKSKKLKGTKENLWRIRSGDYRIIYNIDDIISIVEVRRIGHRKDVYKK